MNKIHLLILLLPLNAHSAWYCNEVASEWVEQGKTLSSCGVGYGKDENEARLNAFENAKKEFNTVCGKETSCAGRVVNIDPQRADCNMMDGQFTCHRLFHFYITAEYAVQDTPVVEKEVVTEIRQMKTEINNISNSYTIIQQPAPKVIKSNETYKFKQFLRRVGSVSIYETNHRGNQGVYLTNPSDTEMEQAIKRASRTGAMNHIYIIRN